MRPEGQGIVPIDVYLTARGKPELKHLFTHSTDTQGGHRVEASRPLALRSGRHNRITVRNRTTGVPETLQQVKESSTLSQPQRSTNERTCDGVYSPSTGTSATRLSFLSLRDSGLALHPSLARGHFLARFCTAVFPLAGGGSITVSLVVSNGRSAPKASHLIGSSLP